MKFRLLASTALAGFLFITPAQADPVSLAVAAASALASSVSFTGGAFVFAGFASFATKFAIAASLGLAAKLLAPKPKAPSFSSLANRTQTIKQSIVARSIVYGEAKVSGPLVYAESTNNNEYLHLVVALAGHEVQAINTIYLNDDELTLDGSGNVTAPTKYVGFVRVKKHLGTATQSADTDLVAESDGKWTSDHKLLGTAYVYVRLKFSQDAFPNGIPNIAAIVQGKKVYDPRTDTTAYSNNAALCLLDYLQDSIYGLGAEDSEVDLTRFEAEANICDEAVALAAGGTQARYSCNGVVESDDSPKSIIEDMLTSCAGTVYYSGGVWSLKVGAYQAPTSTITDDDMRGPISIQTKLSRRDNFNGVKGVFVSPESNWQATDYPSYTSDQFLSEDNNIESFFDLTLPFTTSSAAAQRLAKIALYRNRQQISLEVKCKLTQFGVSVGDIVSITNSRYGWTSKPFEVVSWNFVVEGDQDSPLLGVDMMLKEINAAVFDWDAEETAFVSDNTNLPSAFSIDPPVLSVTDILRVVNEQVFSILVATVNSANGFASTFEVQAKQSTETDFVNLGIAGGNIFELIDVVDGATYNVRARVVNTIGVRSEWVTVNRQIVGKTAPPSDVTNLSINSIGGSAILSWTPVPDADLSHYKVRYSTDTTGASYQNAIDLVDRIARPGNSVIVPSRQGTYFVKAIDKLGLVSVNPATVVLLTDIDSVESMNLVETLIEHPAFTGAKTRTVKVTDGGETWIQLDTALFDSVTSLFDSAGGFFDGGGGTIEADGYYDFSTYVDLSEKYTSRIVASIKNERIDFVNLFDSVIGNFDDRLGDFDGDPTAFDDTNVQLQVATTDDNPAGTPTWSDWRPFFVGDYSARAFKFRAYLTTTDATASPSIRELSVNIDMPDRVIAGNDIVSGAGAYNLTFSEAFKALGGVGIVAQNLATGDYYVITGKSASGFTIEFRNSAGTAVSRTFDYVAKGYGRVI